MASFDTFPPSSLSLRSHEPAASVIDSAGAATGQKTRMPAKDIHAASNGVAVSPASERIRKAF